MYSLCNVCCAVPVSLSFPRRPFISHYFLCFSFLFFSFVLTSWHLTLTITKDETDLGRAEQGNRTRTFLFWEFWQEARKGRNIVRGRTRVMPQKLIRLILRSGSMLTESRWWEWHYLFLVEGTEIVCRLQSKLLFWSVWLPQDFYLFPKSKDEFTSWIVSLWNRGHWLRIIKNSKKAFFYTLNA